MYIYCVTYVSEVIAREKKRPDSSFSLKEGTSSDKETLTGVKRG